MTNAVRPETSALKPFDRVRVYDPDARDWFEGYLEDETAIKTEHFWLVHLDNGPVQYGQKVTVIAVPTSRPDWIQLHEQAAQ